MVIELVCSIQQFGRNILRFASFGRIGFQEIREKEEFQHHENDEEFDEDDRPERLAQSHVAETIVVKIENPIQETVFLHGV